MYVPVDVLRMYLCSSPLQFTTVIRLSSAVAEPPPPLGGATTVPISRLSLSLSLSAPLRFASLRFCSVQVPEAARSGARVSSAGSCLEHNLVDEAPSMSAHELTDPCLAYLSAHLRVTINQLHTGLLETGLGLSAPATFCSTSAHGSRQQTSA